jgi:hypothetical protein
MRLTSSGTRKFDLISVETKLFYTTHSRDLTNKRVCARSGSEKHRESQQSPIASLLRDYRGQPHVVTSSKMPCKSVTELRVVAVLGRAGIHLISNRKHAISVLLKTIKIRKIECLRSRIFGFGFMNN